jgi:16S rRNA G966 N2-methylase RsmD
VFVERSGAVRRVLNANLDATGMAARAEVLGGDAVAHLSRLSAEGGGAGFDLVLLDPPYDTPDETWAEVLARIGALAPTAVVAAESDREVPIPEPWHVLREKRYGSTLLTIARPTPPPEPS